MKSTSRRDFLKTGAAVGAYVAASSVLTRSLQGAAAPNYGPKRLPWALQLYTIGGVAGQDGTFAKLRSFGFTGVEFAGYLGKDAPTLRKMLDDNGLKAVGSHVPGGASALQGDNLKTQIEFNQIIGNPRLIVASGSTGMAPGAAAGGGRGGRGGAPASPIAGMTVEQVTAAGMMDTLTKLAADVTAARTALDQATFSGAKTGLDAKVKALTDAELAQANARAETLAKVQASPNKLTADQVAALANNGRGRGGRGGGAPAPLAITQPSATPRDTLVAAAHGFNAVADVLKPLNMFVGYHSHPQDFNLVDGTPEWDVLFSNMKPEVIMQIDLGHMGTAGGDQPTYMARYPGRAKTVHVKPANGGGKLVGDPGDTNNWPAIFAACEDPKIGGTEWYILEYDGGNMDQVERTMARMKEWGKV